jgi:hypothetical protein
MQPYITQSWFYYVHTYIHTYIHTFITHVTIHPAEMYTTYIHIYTHAFITHVITHARNISHSWFCTKPQSKRVTHWDSHIYWPYSAKVSYSSTMVNNCGNLSTSWLCASHLGTMCMWTMCIICMCVCMYVCMSVCMRMYISHTYMCNYIWCIICSYTRMCVICRCTYIHSYIHTYTHTHTHTYIHTYIHM